jgi:hypothetical protein
MSSNVKPVKVSGELFWANWMSEFNTKFNEDNTKYECTLGMLSDKACEALEELGIKIKNKDTMGKFIVGKSKFVFEPVDEDGNPVDIKKIGNGTKVVALVTSYRHKMSAKFGSAPSIQKLIVTELKTYNPEGAVKEETEDVL